MTANEFFSKLKIGDEFTINYNPFTKYRYNLALSKGYDCSIHTLLDPYNDPDNFTEVGLEYFKSTSSYDFTAVKPRTKKLWLWRIRAKEGDSCWEHFHLYMDENGRNEKGDEMLGNISQYDIVKIQNSEIEVE